VVDVACCDLVRRDDVIGQRDQTAALAHARHFLNRFAGIRIVMEREAARHKVEGIIVKWQHVRVGGLELDVCGSAFAREPLCRGKHLRRQVSRDDARHVGRERQRRMPGAGRNVEHAPAALRLCQLDQARQTRALRVYRTGHIVARVCAELLLD